MVDEPYTNRQREDIDVLKRSQRRLAEASSLLLRYVPTLFWLFLRTRVMPLPSILEPLLNTMLCSYIIFALGFGLMFVFFVMQLTIRLHRFYIWQKYGSNELPPYPVVDPGYRQYFRYVLRITVVVEVIVDSFFVVDLFTTT